ncbi:MAG: hypothetical protein ABIL58_25165 [Pseudomonadota bacterium]
MRISDISVTTHPGRSRLAARLCWEDTPRPDDYVFFETTAAFGQDLADGAEAFAVGCLVPALHFGERRLAVDQGLCPGLKEGLATAMGILAHWSGGRYRPLVIEAADRPPALPPEPGSFRAGLCLSGGIDSLAALRLNRLHYRPEDPWYVEDGLMVHGFDIGGVVARGAKYPVFDRAVVAMETVAADAGITLVPVYTNVRHLCDQRDLWLNYFFGAVLAAAGHAMAGRLELLFIASSYHIPHLHPCGSHPILDPEYSSQRLSIRHRDLALSRLDKHRIVADWPAAFNNFRVCLANVPDRLNCGRCEKCVRTMTELTAIGRLQDTRAFVEDRVTPEHFEGFDITIWGRDHFYRELLEPLAAQGRGDLVATIRKKLAGEG